MAGARVIGLTKDNPYRSLHGDRLRQSDKRRKPSPEIDAPPRGSSSDEELDAQELPDDQASDDSEFGRSEKKQEIGRNDMVRTGTNTRSARNEDGKKRELSVEPSNIRTSSFTSAKGHGSRNSSQSSQKRRNLDLDGDEESIAFSQPKKQPRRSYGSKNRQRSPVTKPENSKRVPPKEYEKPGPVYKGDYSRAMIAQGKRPSRIGLWQMNTADPE